MCKDLGLPINAGDLRLADGQTLTPFKKVLIIDGAACVNPSGFGEIALLPGSPFSDESDKAVLEETTLPK